MVDASTVKEFLTPKTFSIFAYVWLVTHSLFGVPLSSIVAALRASELGKFDCAVTESTAVKSHVEKTCYSRYEQTYNSPLPFYIFVLMSIWLPFSIAVIYSLAVRKRVEEIVSSHEAQTDDEAGNTEQNRNTCSYVFYGYLLQILVRLLIGVLFTVLQYTVFFPNGFDFEFGCSRPTTAKVTSKITNNSNISQLNDTSIKCENSAAPEKDLCGVFVCVLNSVVAFMILVELITLFWQFPRFKCANGRVCDSEFVTVYLLPKGYTRVYQIELTNVECINVYRQQVLKLSRTSDICYGQNTCLDDLFVQVVIHTGRAPHNFQENMDRHKIFEVYQKVPESSKLLKTIKDLFRPNKDTNGTIPHKILAVGRPGIGKTVLTQKILRDWAKGEDDEYYRDKIAFYFKFSWMSDAKFKNLSLKIFLCIAAQLSEEKFEQIYEDVTNYPKKALLIFDGLDEFPGDIMNCLSQPPCSDDPNTCMSGISLFIKLIQDKFLPGATVVVTSRPTASDFYSRFKFDRNVEIIGFTLEQIEQYVRKFCDNNNKSHLKSKIWNHIKSSPDLVNLSYIPVNCFIVSVMLFKCFSDSIDETGAVPTSITELYQAAINHFDKFHNKTMPKESSAEAMKNLKLLAYNSIENGQLVFDEELIDEEMKQSGLLNSISSPIFPVQIQFCFIHLTMQEFLAAKHVIETKALVEIKPFIFSHVEEGKWHLVLQFIAGLLGKKMKMSSEKHLYKDCVSAFTSKGFMIDNGVLDLSYYSVFVVKCLKEVGDEDVAREACETTALKDVVCLTKGSSQERSSSDWAAVTFVSNYMKKLNDLALNDFYSSEECSVEVYKLLQKRCIQILSLSTGVDHGYQPPAEPVFKALMAKCTLNHDQHSKLTKLLLVKFYITDKCWSTICEFLKNGHGRFLEELSLESCRMLSCEFINFEDVCPQLKYLSIQARIRDEGVRVLCNALVGHKKLTLLFLCECSLTGDCMGFLCELLTDRRCNLNVLTLTSNEIGDEGVRIFCEHVLAKKHCTLTCLYLSACLLTYKCLPLLCEVLNDECCKLTSLDLGGNKGIGDEGVRELCKKFLTKEHCNLRELNLDGCSLTDECIPELRNAVLAEHCRLKALWLQSNKFTEEGKKLLREVCIQNVNLEI